MAKKHTDVVDMVRDITDDHEFSDAPLEVWNLKQFPAEATP